VTDRPVIRCIVGKELPDGCHVKKDCVTLEDALDFALFGFAVMQDPFDQSDLVRYEQIQRSLRQKPKWQRW
jgi:hypothetical protein